MKLEYKKVLVSLNEIMIMTQNTEIYFRLEGSKDTNPESQGKNEP